jgi:hypothetical protein
MMPSGINLTTTHKRLICAVALEEVSTTPRALLDLLNAGAKAGTVITEAYLDRCIRWVQHPSTSASDVLAFIDGKKMSGGKRKYDSTVDDMIDEVRKKRPKLRLYQIQSALRAAEGVGYSVPSISTIK